MRRKKEDNKTYLKTDCDFIDGAKVFAVWTGAERPIECVLSNQGGHWFLLQNEKDGAVAPDKKGYRYSWSLGPSWTRGKDDILDICITDKNIQTEPAIKTIASDYWEKFLDALDTVENFASNLSELYEIKDLTAKILKTIDKNTTTKRKTK